MCTCYVKKESKNDSTVLWDGTRVMPADSISGGCACGSIRFTIHQAPSTLRVCVCHCRQCQRAAGGYFATLTKVAPAAGKFVVTKGKISLFASSAVARRK